MINRQFETVSKNDGKYFLYHGVNRTVERRIVNVDGYEYVEFNTRWGVDLISYTGLIAYFNQVVLPSPDESWIVPELNGEFYFSKGNKKIKLAGKNAGLRNPISFGLPSVMSCFDAGKCKEYCYAEVVNSTYLSTLKMALHNYALVNTLDVDALTDAFVRMIDTSETELVRIDDTGDLVDVKEFTAIANAARMRPDVVLYTYTKSTAIVWNYLENGNSIPDNFRVNISSTDNERSSLYATKLVQKYGLSTCFILETAEDILAWWDAGLPFNDVEKMAIASKADFAIALHGTFSLGSTEYHANKMREQIETEFNTQLC